MEKYFICFFGLLFGLLLYLLKRQKLKNKCEIVPIYSDDYIIDVDLENNSEVNINYLKNDCIMECHFEKIKIN